MSTHAYILITCMPNKTQKVYLFLKSTENIHVDIVTGHFDLIVQIERENSDEILDFVVKELRYTIGVLNTVTCFAVSRRNSK
jgi:DNA-binding Lrp family transcriptional regulator